MNYPAAAMCACASHQLRIRKYNYSYYMLIDAEEDPPILSYPCCRHVDYPPLLSSTLHDEQLYIEPRLTSTLISVHPDQHIYDNIDSQYSTVYSQECWYYGRYNALSPPARTSRFSSKRAVRFCDSKFLFVIFLYNCYKKVVTF